MNDNNQFNNNNRMNGNNQFNNNNQININNQINNNHINNNNFNFSNPLLMNISNIFKNTQFEQYKNMLNFQHFDQSIKKAQKQNQKIMKLVNYEYPILHDDDDDQEQNPFEQIDVNFQLTFSVVPEFGDQSLNNNIKILSQVRSTYTVKMAIDNFFIKLVKPRESIKRFLLNGNVLDPQCGQTLSSMNINHNTIIKAIKSENFNQLRLI